MAADSKKVMITGGAGFIGSELARQAIAHGHRVEVVDNLLNGRKENLAGLPPDLCRLTVADVRDAARMKEVMEGCDVVYHLACLCVRNSIHDPLENHDVNATGAIRVLQAAREVGVEAFVFTSSAEVYGSACRGPVREENELAPTNVYGGAKMAAEGYARAYNVCYGVPTIILRLFNTFGPRCHHEGDCGEVIPKFLLRAMAGKPLVVFGDGHQTRDFNYVEDTARAILTAGLCKDAIGQVMNVGSGRETSVNEIARAVIEVVGNSSIEVVHDAPRPADIARMCADGSRARAILGYAPEVSLKVGLTRLMEWYEENGISADGLLTEEVVHNWDGEELKAVVRANEPQSV
jgi:UDP-glucose 4-epimerase